MVLTQCYSIPSNSGKGCKDTQIHSCTFGGRFNFFWIVWQGMYYDLHWLTVFLQVPWLTHDSRTVSETIRNPQKHIVAMFGDEMGWTWMKHLKASLQHVNSHHFIDLRWFLRVSWKMTQKPVTFFLDDESRILVRECSRQFCWQIRQLFDLHPAPSMAQHGQSLGEQLILLEIYNQCIHHVSLDC